ncbi:MAG: NAD(P)H-hydrate dehydratase [Spirochaetales bacterium]|nr:NAD(P)H-hydrate dehydratase [Spirochaetales bacterium]
MKIVSTKVMSEIDNKAINHFGIPGLLLMENAGIKCWTYIKDFIEKNTLNNTNIVIIAGSGNNGGDALVIARQAWNSGFKKIKIIISKETGSEMYLLHRKICDNLGIPVVKYKKEEEAVKEAFSESGLIIDGITGTGLLGSLRSDASELVKLVNSSSGLKISIDIPSGLGEEFQTNYPVIKADLTLTIGLPKTILYYPSLRNYSGEIIVVKIGFPPSLLENIPDAGDINYRDKPILPVIPAWAYKGTRGHTAVYAGASGTVGAAVLSASAAGRARSGLVTLFIDSELYKVAASRLTSIMVKKIETERDNFTLKGFTSILAGPGWGTDSRGELLEKFFDSNLPGVLDADGLHLLVNMGPYFDKYPGKLKGRWVFTPHPGEYESISGVDKEKFLSSPLAYLRKTASQYGAVIVLKSHVTFIVTPGGDYTVVDGMNPSLGTGGSGDILSGIIAGFLAQGIEPYNAAVLGVTLHQNIGRSCFNDNGWFLAEDLLPYISREIKNMEIF